MLVDGKQIGVIEIDPTTDPKVINFTRMADPDRRIAGGVSEEIYALDDEWKMCRNLDTEGMKERPTGFVGRSWRSGG